MQNQPNRLAPIVVEIFFAKPQRFSKPLRFKAKKMERKAGKWLIKMPEVLLQIKYEF